MYLRNGHSPILLAATVVGTLGLTTASRGFQETIVLQSGVNFSGVPLTPGQVQLSVRCESPTLLCGAAFAGAPFTSQFAAADMAGPAFACNVHPAWAVSLPNYPNARWINSAIDVNANSTPKSALYSVPFYVGTVDIANATISMTWNADDRLGDPAGPNFAGVYLNGSPVGLAFSGGGFAGSSTVTAQADITGMLRSGDNRLHIYQRDLVCVASGVLYGVTIRAYPCNNGFNGQNTWIETTDTDGLDRSFKSGARRDRPEDTVVCSGSGTLAEIHTCLQYLNGTDGVDLYKIHIPGPLFSATVTGGWEGMPGSVFLFKPDGTPVVLGRGIYGSADPFIALYVAPGDYLLAVAAHSTVPLDAQGDPLWLLDFEDMEPVPGMYAPDGSTAPFADWIYTFNADNAPCFVIHLDGAAYLPCPPILTAGQMPDASADVLPDPP